MLQIMPKLFLNFILSQVELHSIRNQKFPMKLAQKYMKQTEIPQKKFTDDLKNANQKIKHQLNNPRQPLQCRICLDNQFSSLQKFISPCGCIGSVKYVHFNCIKRWITRAIDKDQKVKKQGTLKCEICKSMIKFQLNQKRRCNQVDLIKQNIKKQKVFATLMLISMIVIFLFLVTLFSFSLKNQIFTKKERKIQTIVVSISLSMMVIFLGIVAYIFISDFLISSQTIIAHIYEKKDFEPPYNQQNIEEGGQYTHGQFISNVI